MECRGLGGPKMEKAGFKLLYDMTTFSALGFGDVIRQYFRYRKVFYAALNHIKKNKPDALVLIDSPGFNLRFAKKIKKQLPVIYYISPQIWAWGMRRIHTIKKTVSKMLVLLPFEKELYDKHKVDCDFVGHPLLDQAKPSRPRKELREEFEIPANAKAVGILPGSRVSEVQRILPPMLKTAVLLKRKFPQCRFYLTEAPNVPKSVYDEIIHQHPKCDLRRTNRRLYDVISAMDFALITSGTVTTEAAILGTPFFLFYKAAWSTYYLGKFLIRVPYLGLVNLLARRPIVPEFIQRNIKPVTIAHEADVLLNNPGLYTKMKRDFEEVKSILGSGGASQRAAKSIVSFLTSSSENNPKRIRVQQPAEN
ncbi:lipid-A-disaccharide synthase [Omnitrophica bacterium]|nr:lipid-A-disaccharide synthase [Candidatus Omnitrophota bacterium]